jgi:uncharacterized protein (TIGR02996 family)
VRWTKPSGCDTEAELFRAIRENPDDPAPRLVYADWLEERGDVRAEMIRIAGDRSPRARTRFRELQSEHYAAWLAALPAWAKRPSYHFGFLSWIVVDDLATTLAHRTEIVAMMPIPSVELEGDLGGVRFSCDGLLALHHRTRRRGTGSAHGSAGTDVFTVYDDTRAVWTHEHPYEFADDGDRVLSSTDRLMVRFTAAPRTLVFTYYRAADNGPPSPEHATPQTIVLP